MSQPGWPEEGTLRDLVENAPVALHWVEGDGTILWANAAELALLGYTHDEYIGHHIGEFHADEDVINDILCRLRSGETLHEYEARLRCKDGSIRHVSISSNVLTEDGKFVHTRCFTRDITEYKRDEEVRSRLAAIVEFSDDAIISKDLHGVITSWNRGAERLFGYTAAEMIGQSMSLLIPPDRHDEEPRIFAQIGRGNPVERYETIRRRKDGTELHISLTVSPIRDIHKNVIGASEIARDITDRKRAEEAIRDSQMQLKAELADTNLLHSISAILIEEDDVQALYEKILDAAVSVMRSDFASLQMYYPQRRAGGELHLLGYRGFNHRAAKFWEWVAADSDSACGLALRTGNRYLIPDVKACAVNPDREVYLQTGIRAVQATPLISRNGGLVGMISTHWGRPHQPSERDLRLLDILARQAADLMERKQVEVALREMNDELESRVKDRTQELTQSQQHLRALASELNLTEQKERKRLAGELHDYLGQLLALSRIKLSQTKHQPMSPVVAKIVADVQESIDKSIAYTRTLVSQLSPPVLHEFGLSMALEWLAQEMLKRNLRVALDMKTDASHLPEDQALLLFQCVRELLFNCVKHAKVKEAAITLEQIGEMLHIRIADQGAGFEPSLVTSPEAVANEAGHGFGLFSIRERMLSLGGRFDVQSAPGKGTMATLVLPVSKRKASPVLGDEKTTHGPGHALRHMSDNAVSTGHRNGARPFSTDSADAMVRVLLVDDHAMVRKGLSSLLEAYTEFQVIGEAANGEEAVLMARQLRPDVILMDVTMPKLDGIEATRRIKQEHPDMVVIGLSVHNGEPVEAAIREAGAAALLSKDAAVDSLYETILGMRQAKSVR